jgi:hypothetical protein
MAYRVYEREYLDRFITIINGEKGSWQGISHVGEVGTLFK